MAKQVTTIQIRQPNVLKAVFLEQAREGGTSTAANVAGRLILKAVSGNPLPVRRRSAALKKKQGATK